MFFILNKSYLFFYFLVISIFIVYGCSSNTYAPVEQGVKTTSFYKNSKKGIHKNREIVFHYVRKRETLYSIAWQYGLDFKDIAKWNKITAPYVIKVGQKIRLRSFRYKSKNRYKSKKTSVKKQLYKKTKLKQVKTISKYPKKKYKYSRYKKSKSKNKTSKAKYSNKKKVLYKNKLTWVWPTKGRVVQHFSPVKGKKGIDIAVLKGTRIKASESGRVVYSGHGLRGYGLLIIIKHNNQYLSAYAHNSKLLIEEGSKVKRNQVIALAGKTASERVKLHFEIRKNGKPVNPLNYLPK